MYTGMYDQRVMKVVLFCIEGHKIKYLWTKMCVDGSIFQSTNEANDTRGDTTP